MSRENVELIKAAVEAWNSGEMDATLAMMDPEFELVTVGSFPDLAPIYRGHEGWVTFWREFRGPWESLTVTADEFREVGDHVVLLMTFSARGRTGLEVHRKFATVWTFRDALAVKIQSYGDPSAALEAVGLSE